MHNQCIINHSYCLGYYSFTPQNPDELKNALTQYWNFYAQSTMAILVMKAQIPCNLKFIGKTEQCFMNIFECLLNIVSQAPIQNPLNQNFQGKG